MRRLRAVVGRARERSRRFPRSFWLLVAGEGVAHFGYGVFLPYVAIYLVDGLGASPSVTGAVIALWALTGIAMSPVAGLAADRLGRRPPLLVGLAGSAACAVAFGLVTSVTPLLVVIPIWGIVSAGIRPAARAYVTDVVPPALRVEAFGIERLVGNATFALGPPVGALIVLFGSMRLIFLITGLATLAYFFVALLGLPETNPAAADDAEPPRFRDALRDVRLLALAGGSALGWFVYALYDDVLGVFLVEERGYAVATWGLVFAINPVAVTLFQYPIARWAARRSSRLVLALGIVSMGAGLAILLPFSGLAALVVAVCVVVLGEMLESPVSTAVAADLAPSHLRASYQSVLSLSLGVSGTPALLLGFWLIDEGRFELLLAAALPIALAGALCFRALPAGPSGRAAAVALPAEVP